MNKSTNHRPAFPGTPRHAKRVAPLALAIAAFVCGSAQAGSVTIPNTFNANTPAVASQVNDNFSAVATGVNGNASDIANVQTLITSLQNTVSTLQTTVNDQANTITTLQGSISDQASTITTLQGTINTQASTISALQNDLDVVEGNSVLALDGKLVSITDPATGQPTARFTGVNVQVVNNTGSSFSNNGLGNLIIGYNNYADTREFCSDGQYETADTCLSPNVWAANQRTGSHNLILGEYNAYSRYGGLLAGMHNVINGANASVTGGRESIASGQAASVSGGYGNVASGNFSAVSGGLYNTASGGDASISGGQLNIASGASSSVCGGSANSALGSASTVGGGTSRSTGATAPGNDYDWVAGALFENN
jgi:hypothetical protein